MGLGSFDYEGATGKSVAKHWIFWTYLRTPCYTSLPKTSQFRSYTCRLIDNLSKVSSDPFIPGFCLTGLGIQDYESVTNKSVVKT